MIVNVFTSYLIPLLYLPFLGGEQKTHFYETTYSGLYLLHLLGYVYVFFAHCLSDA